MNSILTENLEQIKALCRQHKVKALYAFSSVVRDDFQEDSDLDLLVEFTDPLLPDYAQNYFNLEDALSRQLHRQVDLVSMGAGQNPVFRKALQQLAVKCYG